MTTHHVTSLAPRLRLRLAKLLELTSSPADNEALMAAREAHRLVREAGCNWEQVLMPPELPACTCSQAPGWLGKARHVLEEHFDLVTPWELRFLACIVERPLLTFKQRKVLYRIIEKTCGEVAA